MQEKLELYTQTILPLHLFWYEPFFLLFLCEQEIFIAMLWKIYTLTYISPSLGQQTCTYEEVTFVDWKTTEKNVL